jgi:hypothetical protein
MKCPICKFQFSFFKQPESFVCKKCGSRLKVKTSWVMVLTSVMGGIPWLLAEMSFFGFTSVVTSTVIYLLSDLLVLMIVLRVPGFVEATDASTHGASEW